MAVEQIMPAKKPAGQAADCTSATLPSANGEAWFDDGKACERHSEDTTREGASRQAITALRDMRSSSMGDFRNRGETRLAQLPVERREVLRVQLLPARHRSGESVFEFRRSLGLRRGGRGVGARERSEQRGHAGVQLR